MSTSRRNIIIRSNATIVGDITVGVAFASAAVWIIESAALGLLLSHYGIERLCDLPAADFMRVVRSLEAKRKAA